MKIRFVKSIDGLKKKKDFTEVILKEKIKQSRFIVKNGREILEVKTEEKKKINRRKWIILVRGIIRLAKNYGVEKIILNRDELIDFPNLEKDNLGQLFAEATEMANYEFRKYKKKPKEGWRDIKEIILISKQSGRELSDFRKAIQKGQMVAKRINYARELANISGGDLTPKKLVSEIRKIIKGTKIKMKVLGEKEMKKIKMNGVLAVGQGSKEQSQFIILEYKNAKQTTDKPTVLVGKGVTFDSGGIDTKPHPHGLEMMMDMSGAASVLSTLLAVNDLEVKKNVVVLIPAVENMPSGSSMRPGDVIKMYNGLNVEIGHTDAEGRLILADALAYAKKFKPERVIDVATLTGAALVALGTKATAMLTRDNQLAQKTEAVAEKTGDYVWRLPLWEEYEGDIVGERGDIANINTKAKSGDGSTITAGIFLWNFAKKYDSWMHLDIAPRMTADSNEQLSKGAAAPAVRLLVKLLEE
jgi:leucyl aminopeptidase